MDPAARPDHISAEDIPMAATTFEGYCVKCHEKRQITDGEVVTAGNGRPMQRGNCPVCKTRVTRMGAPKPA